MKQNNSMCLCCLLATLLLAIGQVRKSARESGMSFKEYGMIGICELYYVSITHELHTPFEYCLTAYVFDT